MAYIGTNNMITQFKQSFENTINQALKDGLPPTVIKLVMENYSYIIDNLVKTVIAREDEQYRKQLFEEQSLEQQQSVNINSDEIMQNEN